MKIINICLFAFFYIISTSTIFAENVFSIVKMPDNFEVNVGENFKKEIVVNYTGNIGELKASISGDKRKTGLLVESPTYISSGIYSITLSGTPQVAGKYKLKFYLSDKKKNSLTQFIEFNVNGIKFATTTLPTAYGVRKVYTTKIYFTNPSKIKPKFSYNFPIEFGMVRSDIEDGKDFTTISFYPSKKGNFKFVITALGDRNEVLGTTKMSLNVKDESTKNENKSAGKATTTPKVQKALSVKSINWFNWKN